MTEDMEREGELPKRVADRMLNQASVMVALLERIEKLEARVGELELAANSPVLAVMGRAP